MNGVRDSMESEASIQTTSQSEANIPNEIVQCLLDSERAKENAISKMANEIEGIELHGIEQKEQRLQCQVKNATKTDFKAKGCSKKIDSKLNTEEKILRSEVEMEVDEDTICGIGSFRPQWLQAWATPRSFLTIYSIIGVLQGSFSAYFVGVMSTLEKRYAFKSKVSGTILMVDEIVPFILGSLVGYIGTKVHRPRLLALGMLMSCICCLLSAMPYFMYGTAQHFVSYLIKNGTGLEVCTYEPKSEKCEEDDRPPTISVIVILLIGSSLKGFGNLTYFAIGLTYLDDNTKKLNTPIYLGLSLSFRLLGPVLGFLMSSIFLKYYENPLEDPGFSPADPRWVGAWWIGFVLQAVLLLIFSSPILLLPRSLPSMRKIQISNENEETIAEKMRGLWIGLKRLRKNPLFVCISGHLIFSVLGAAGPLMTVTKYTENQFRLSPSNASLYAGLPCMISIQIFIIIGGVVIWKFRPGPRKLIGGVVFSDTLAVFGFLMLMIPSCGNLHMGGATETPYGLDLVNECNRDCQCTTSVFTPLCAADGYSSYFSPCYAGCSAFLQNSTSTESFENCSCIENVTEGFGFLESMEKGRCTTEGCWIQTVIYLLLLPCTYGLMSMFKVANVMILLRSVSPPDKSFALGTFESLMCIFGSVPYPIIYGALVDSTCLVWEKSCGKTGNCWLYDNDELRTLLHGVSTAFLFMSTLFAVGMLMLSSRLRNIYDDEECSNEMPNKNDTDFETKNSSDAINEKMIS